MKTLSIREMRGALSRIDRILEEESEIIVSRRGEAVARVLPVEPRRRMPSHADLRSRMPRLSASEDLIRDDRDERG
jgi:antitoxin (DNA-binding transcriptional repressor) of toxin-antitoxin stability system